MDIIRAQEQSRDLHESFHNQVRYVYMWSFDMIFMKLAKGSFHKFHMK